MFRDWTAARVKNKILYYTSKWISFIHEAVLVLRLPGSSSSMARQDELLISNGHQSINIRTSLLNPIANEDRLLSIDFVKPQKMFSTSVIKVEISGAMYAQISVHPQGWSHKELTVMLSSHVLVLL